MKIHGLNKLTLLDYPEHMAATIFTGYCNFRCPFCHNAALVLEPETQPLIPEEDFFELLNKRKGVLEGVCITGGEPTLQPDLYEFIEQIKAMGYLVKLDTNGSNPDMLKKLVENKLLDMVALDIKNSFEDYSTAIGIPGYDSTPIEESADFLMCTAIPYEFRTTIVSPLHTEESMHKIGKRLSLASAYYLQQFIDSGRLINAGGLAPYDKQTLIKYADILRTYIKNVNIRGI